MIDDILLDEIKFNYGYKDVHFSGEEVINKVKVLDNMIVKYIDDKGLSGFVVIDGNVEISITYDSIRKRVMKEINNKVNDAPVKIGEGLYMEKEDYDKFVDGIVERLIKCMAERNN